MMFTENVKNQSKIDEHHDDYRYECTQFFLLEPWFLARILSKCNFEIRTTGLPEKI